MGVKSSGWGIKTTNFLGEIKKLLQWFMKCPEKTLKKLGVKLRTGELDLFFGGELFAAGCGCWCIPKKFVEPLPDFLSSSSIGISS